MDLIVTHINADFDAVASAMAVQKLYPEAKILLPSSLEKKVRDFLDIYQPFEILKPKDVLSSTEAIHRLIVVDAQSADRIEYLQEIIQKHSPKIFIYDHHPEGADKLDAVFEQIEPLGAASSLLVELLQRHQVQITPLEATLLALGIYEETGSFLYSSSTARDLLAGAYLLKRGANLKIISSFLTSELTKDEFALMNELLHNTQELTLYDVTVRIAKATLETYGDVAHLARRLMKIQDIDCIFLLFATPDKTIIIARSDATALNVANVLKAFGGGGHASAAAATVKHKSPDELEPELIEAIKANVSPSKTARDIMSSPVISVSAKDSIRYALSVMTRYGINVVAVLKGRAFFGTISREIASKAIFHGFARAQCEEFTTTDLKVATPQMPVSEVETLMLEHNQRFIPVIENEKIIGAITRTDIMRFMYESLLKKDKVPLKEQSYGAGVEKNISALLKARLPSDVYSLLIEASRLSDEMQINAYLVGGCVRDLIRGEENLDIDLVVEHNAIDFAERFAKLFDATVSPHIRFQTAHVTIPNFNGRRFDLDIATARTEYYEKPGSLPKVQASSIKKDLYRRDFTINALAVQINARHFGRLLDFFGGQRDIKDRFIRVLHNLSFVEDPTRAYRAVRFAVRFNYRISKHTDNLIKHAVKANIFANVSGSRILEELRLIFEETEPIMALKMLSSRGLLTAVHQGLNLTDTKMTILKSLQDVITWFELSFEGHALDRCVLYLTALLSDVTYYEKVFERLCVPRKMSETIKEALNATSILAEDIIARYRYFKSVSIEVALYAMAVCPMSERRFFAEYFFKYRLLKPSINGNDLKAIGIPSGPIYKEIFQKIIEEKLLDKLKDKDEELNFAKALYETTVLKTHQ